MPDLAIRALNVVRCPKRNDYAFPEDCESCAHYCGHTPDASVKCDYCAGAMPDHTPSPQAMRAAREILQRYNVTTVMPSRASADDLARIIDAEFSDMREALESGASIAAEMKKNVSEIKALHEKQINILNGTISDMREVLEAIDRFWREGTAPLSRDAYITEHDNPISLEIRAALGKE
jgi:ABC-type Zn uptake system ZnuABC Zn-binding protein ZnuA